MKVDFFLSKINKVLLLAKYDKLHNQSNINHVLPVTIPPYFLKKEPNTSDVIADNFIRMLMEGPEVSLRGSPTVSPITAAL
jgi:hypothetical protein